MAPFLPTKARLCNGTMLTSARERSCAVSVEMDPGAKRHAAFRHKSWLVAVTQVPLACSGVYTIQKSFLENMPQSESMLIYCVWQLTNSIRFCASGCPSPLCLAVQVPFGSSGGRGWLRQRAGTLPYSEGKAGSWGLCCLALYGSSSFLAQH